MATAYFYVFPGLAVGNWVQDAGDNNSPYLPDNVNPLNTGTINVDALQTFALYDGATYIGDFTIADVPEGFAVVSILMSNWIAKLGGAVNFPSSTNNEQAFSRTNGINIVGGWTAWDAPLLGISSASPIFNPALFGHVLLSGNWSIEGTAQVSFGFFDPTLPRVPRISLPLTEGGIPLAFIPGDCTLVQATVTYDAGLCPVLTPITNLTVTDPVTGAISWIMPGGNEDGTIIKITNGITTQVYYLDNAVTTYIPSLSGDLTLTLYATSINPVCKSSAVSIQVTVTTPFIFVMGNSEINAGINLGGTPILQFIVNPSGIYTIVPGKTNDTLYDRIPAVTSQVVKIPDPYVKTAFIGE
jgi:hypothetical protein